MSQAAVLAGYPWPKRKPRVEATIHGWQPEGLRGESLEGTKETEAPSLSEGNGSSLGGKELNRYFILRNALNAWKPKNYLRPSPGTGDNRR